MSKRLCVSALVFALAGCSIGCAAFRGALTAPDKGGASWLELRSPHFVLQTDRDREPAREILGELERSHAALAYVLRRPPVEEETLIEIVLFARQIDFAESTGRDASTGAYFASALPLDSEPRPVIVMPSSEVIAENRATWQHELTHRFLHERFPVLPRWLDEGMAEFYSSLGVENGRIHLGGPASSDFSDRPYFWTARLEGDVEQSEVPLRLAPTLHGLVDGDRAEFYPDVADDRDATNRLHAQTALYAAAWRLVHMLTNGPNDAYRAAFAGYVSELEKGAEVHEAFVRRFGADLRTLENDYHAYLSKDGPPRTAVQYAEALAAPSIVEHEMAASDVHLLWARIIRSPPNKLSPRASQELDAAFALNPRAPEVLLCKAQLGFIYQDLDAAKKDLDALLREVPEDPRALRAQMTWERLHAEDQRASAEAIEMAPPAALVDRLAKVATTAHQLNGVAWHYGVRGRVNEGLDLARRAIRKDPLCYQCQDTYAVLLWRNGRIDEALFAINRAIAIAPEDVAIQQVLDHKAMIQAAR